MIVTLAVIPARTVGGTLVNVTVTGYETTLPVVLPVVVGRSRSTLPSTEAPTAVIETVAAWPTAIDARSLSTTSAVTW